MFKIFLFADRMAGNWKEEIKMENIEIKEEIQEEMFQFSTVEDTCIVYTKEEDGNYLNSR